MDILLYAGYATAGLIVLYAYIRLLSFAVFRSYFEAKAEFHNVKYDGGNDGFQGRIP